MPDWHSLIVFRFAPENRLLHFMQIFRRRHFHEMSKPIFLQKNKKTYFKMSSAELLSVNSVS